MRAPKALLSLLTSPYCAEVRLAAVGARAPFSCSALDHGTPADEHQAQSQPSSSHPWPVDHVRQTEAPPSSVHRELCSPSSSACTPQRKTWKHSTFTGNGLLVRRNYGSEHSTFGGAQWQKLAEEYKVNPCNSKLHPAVAAGIVPDGEELCVQDAYNPESTCWGCGPSHPDGLHLRSKRIQGGLEARISVPSKYCAFPGIINGGIISTIMDCHGNWTAAIALMDRSVLPRPPLTLTKSMLVTFKEPTPPDTELLVTSKVVDVQEVMSGGMTKAAVEVDVYIYAAQPEPGSSEPHGRLLAHGSGMFKRSGALRSL